MANQLEMTDEITQELLNTAPGRLHVRRRNDEVVPYDDTKIANAIIKAFIAVEGNQAAASNRVRELIQWLVTKITQDFLRQALNSGFLIHIENIQDKVEKALMGAGEHQVARKYVLYREEHRKLREINQELPHDPSLPQVILDDGAKVPLNLQRLTEIIREACFGFDEVNSKIIVKETLRNLFDGVSIKDVNKAAIMSARMLIEKEPNYTYVASRLLLNDLRREALSFLDICSEATQSELSNYYPEAFKRYIDQGIELEMLDPSLKTVFDLEELSQALVSDRDLKFTYLGLQTLYDRYFIHTQGTRL